MNILENESEETPEVNSEEEIDNTSIDSIAKLVDAAANKDFVNANKEFEDLMSSRIADALDQEKIKVSNAIFNDFEEEDTDVDDVEDSESEEDAELEDILEPEEEV